MMNDEEQLTRVISSGDILAELWIYSNAARRRGNSGLCQGGPVQSLSIFKLEQLGFRGPWRMAIVIALGAARWSDEG